MALLSLQTMLISLENSSLHDQPPSPLSASNQSAEPSGYFVELMSRLERECQEQSQGGGTDCDSSELYRTLNGYAFVPMLATCVFGNVMNVAVYRRTNMRHLPAVRMLAVKAVLNTIFIVSLVPSALRLMGVWGESSYWEYNYWISWPYFLLSANASGACATWVVVLMTLERYLYIVYPVRSRQLCTNANFAKVLTVIACLALALNSFFPLSHTVERHDHPLCPPPHNAHYQFAVNTGSVARFYETLYHHASLVFTLVVPLMLLSAMSVVILRRLLCRRRPGLVRVKVWRPTTPANTPRTTRPQDRLGGSTTAVGRRRSEQRRCVTRVTISTTLAHLMLELPSVSLYAAAAFAPSRPHVNSTMCVCQSVANFLGLCNASVLFFIYLLFSPTYRRLFMALICCDDAPETMLESFAGVSQFFDRSASTFSRRRADTSPDMMKQNNNDVVALLKSDNSTQLGTETYYKSNESVV